MSNAESEAVLKRFLDFLQGDRRLRIGIGVLLLGVLGFFAIRAGLAILPRRTMLSISGGDIVGNRHALARILQSEAGKSGLDLTIKPISGSLAILDKVSKGELDVALVQGGLEEKFPNVEQVAVIMPEYLHLLVRPGISGLTDLKGRTVNVSAKSSGTHEIALAVLEFANYKHDVDYVEKNFGAEELLALPERRMPDAIFVISTVPSFLVSLLVEEHGYRVMEIPFPKALALRHGWAADGKILAYAYDVDPPMPEKDLTTLAINLYLVANSNADPVAVAKLLETLMGPSTQSRLGAVIDEKQIVTPTGYPVSEGTRRYLARNDSIFTVEAFNKAAGAFGLVMSFSGMLLVLINWFKGPEPTPVTHDEEFHGYIAEIVEIERALFAKEDAEAIDRKLLADKRRRLHELLAIMLARYATSKFADALLFDRTMAALRSAQAHADAIAPNVRDLSPVEAPAPQLAADAASASPTPEVAS